MYQKIKIRKQSVSKIVIRGNWPSNLVFFFTSLVETIPHQSAKSKKHGMYLIKSQD